MANVEDVTLPDLSAQLREKLVKIGLSDDEALVFKNQGVTSPEMLAFLSDDDLKSLFNVRGLRNVNQLTRIKVRALKSWIRSIGEGEISLVECTVAVLSTEMRKIARLRDTDKKATQKESTPVSPDKFDGALKSWKTFKLAFQSYLARLKNAKGKPIYYVIRSVNEQADDATISDDVTTLSIASASVLLAGEQYDEDKARVFQELKALTAAGTGWTHIRSLDKDEDGRAAWLWLVSYYEGDSMTGAIRSEARKQIETTFYVGKTQKMTLERFINVHKSAHMDLEEHGSSM
ncbi:MAG: hypothetical protein ACRDL7_01845, partial [Gaiellaceae bacterium]